MDSRERFCIRITNSIVSDKIYESISQKYNRFLSLALSQGKNEKREIKITDSETKVKVYESEVFEDVSDLAPALLVSLNNSSSNSFSITVEYSSTATRGKEIVLCSIDVKVTDLLSHPAKFINLAMSSEYEVQAVLMIVMVPSFEPLFNDAFLAPVAPLYSHNPLRQQFAFGSSDSGENTVVEVEESAWEPRLAFKVSLLVLENSLNALLTSHRAWTERRMLETFRQGFFESTEAALACGWQELAVSVPAARLRCEPVYNRYISHTKGGKEGPVKYTTHVPLYHQDLPYTNAAEAAAPVTDTTAAKAVRGSAKSGGVTQLLTRGMEFLTPSSSRQQPGLNTGGKRHGDEHYPSTYVGNIHGGQVMDSYLRECCRLLVVAPARKENQSEAVAGRGTTLQRDIKSCTFLTYESTDRYFEPEEASTSASSETVVATVETSVAAVTFRRFIPPTATRLLFEVYEIIGKSPRKIASYAQPLVAVGSIPVTKWATAALVLQDAAPHAESAAVDHNTTEVALLLQVSVQRPQQTFSFDQRASARHDMRSVDLLGLDSPVASPAASPTSHSPVANLEPISHAPSIMPYSSVAARLPSGERVTAPLVSSSNAGSSTSSSSGPAKATPSLMTEFTSANKPAFSPDYTDVLSDCYSWLWHLGLSGVDPLSADIEAAFLRSRPESRLKDVPLYRGFGHKVDETQMLQFVVPRVDWQYPLAWLDRHILALEEALLLVATALVEGDAYSRGIIPEEATASPDYKLQGRYFRPSVHKKLAFAQAMPKNLHFQTLVVRRHGQTQSQVLDSVTCGCMSPHGLRPALPPPRSQTLQTQQTLPRTDTSGMAPPQHGGLLHFEVELQDMRRALNCSKQHFDELVYPVPGQTAPLTGLYPSSSSQEWQTLNEVGAQAQLYESALLSMGRRKVFPLAQVLSVAVNAFMSRIALVMEGKIPDSIASRWLSSGFLLVFECLLSVIGKEKTMLEDSYSAVAALQLYRIRLLSSDGLPALNTSAESSLDPRTRDLLRRQQNSDLTAEQLRRLVAERVAAQIACHRNAIDNGFVLEQRYGDSVFVESRQASQQLSVDFGLNVDAAGGTRDLLNEDSDSPRLLSTETTVSVMGLRRDVADVTLRGREVLLYLPTVVLDKLPPVFRQRAERGGAIIPLVPVLFTQGIDLQQSVASSLPFDSGRSSLQLQMNLQALAALNTYCYQYAPELTPTSATRAPPQGSSGSLSELDDTARAGLTFAALFPTLRPVASNETVAATEDEDEFSSPPKSLQAPGFSQQSLSSTRRKITAAAASVVGMTSARVVDAGSPAAATVHPLMQPLDDAIRGRDRRGKNVDMLEEVEKVCYILFGCRVTFCKSGKDRTGMAVTLCQARHLGLFHQCAAGDKDVFQRASAMRLSGVRLMVAEKNIGRKVFSFNRLQVQFLPPMYRPPLQVCESMLKKDSS
ncbi:unnamed protein product [Sphagnum jensenii]|uniref:Uncharacterized protein n=1 Tax=Sphagnum jensenii TaxID=128206 RepID=A0ABP0VA94_9BRYO